MTTRRGLLAAAGLTLLPLGEFLADDDVLTHRARRVAALVGRSETARTVANTYLSGIGATDWRLAADALNMPTVLAPMDGIEETEAARAWLGARIRADFAEGAVIDVDGWRLSRTEVGACLLASGAA